MQCVCRTFLVPFKALEASAFEDTALTLKDIESGPDCLSGAGTGMDGSSLNSSDRCIRVIGRGGFGVVKMVRAKKTGVRLVA